MFGVKSSYKPKVSESKGIEKLKELTSKLPVLGGAVEEVPVDCGTVFRWNIFTECGVKVTKMFCSAGVEMEEHVHPEDIIAIVYKGSVFITINGEEHLLRRGSFLHIERNSVVSFRCLEDCIGIHIFIS